MYDSRVSLTTRVLIGLVAGFLVGFALSGSASPAASTIVAIAAPVGTIFVNLIRMTVLPLVASMLIASVGALASSGAIARAGWRAAVVAIAVLAAVAAATVLIASPILLRIRIDQSAVMALRPAAVASSATPV